MSKYDVYVLDTFKAQGATQLFYKLLIADKQYSTHDDHIDFVDSKTIQDMYHDDKFNFHNLTCDENNNIWLSSCKQPFNTVADTQINLRLTRPTTIWEFLWDVIINKIDILLNDMIVPSSSIQFSMNSDDIYIIEPNTEQMHLIWTTPELSSIKRIDKLRLLCDRSFYNKWNHFVGSSGSYTQSENKGVWQIRTWELKCSYNNAYSTCRFCDYELVYLAEHYLLLKSQLLGVELGHWFMQRLNNIVTDVPQFSSIISKGKGQQNISFIFDVDLPDANAFAIMLTNNADTCYEAITKLNSVQSILSYFGRSIPVCNNNYYLEFIKGFLSQLPCYKQVILDHEYLFAKESEYEVTALACRIFVYRLIKLQLISRDSDLYIHDGALRMEVIK